MVKNKPLFTISFILAILTIPLGIIIWPPAAGSPMPTSIQLPFFIGLSLFEGLSFGAGFYFLFDGLKLLKKFKVSDRLTTLTHLAITWTIISWWPHDHIHMHNGMDLTGLLFIEYGFHVTLIISGIIIAKFFYKTLEVHNKSYE